MQYFHNLSSSSEGFAPKPHQESTPGSRWEPFVPRSLICPPLEKNPAGAHSTLSLENPLGPFAHHCRNMTGVKKSRFGFDIRPQSPLTQCDFKTKQCVVFGAPTFDIGPLYLPKIRCSVDRSTQVWEIGH